jgi:hypothetical protein
MSDLDARCRFYVRTVLSEGPPPTARYDAINVRGWHDDGCVHTQHPPTVGDLVYLIDDITKTDGTYRVLERAWSHPNYGSAYWLPGTPTPKRGPSVDYIVERAEGLFRHEVPAPQDA